MDTNKKLRTHQVPCAQGKQFMKIFRICPEMPLMRPFRKVNDLRRRSFAEQIEIFQAENIILPGHWAACMEAEGFEVFETLYSDSDLQSKWAVEHGCGHLVRDPDYLFKIVKEQVKAFRPEIIFLYAGAFVWLPRRLREELRTAAPSVAIMTGFWGDELPPNNTYKNYFGDLDVVFCSSSIYQQHFEAAGIPAVTTGNAFDPSIRYETPAAKKRDFIFCGTSGYGYPDHIGRYEKLAELMSKCILEVWTTEPRIRRLPIAVKMFVLNLAAKFPYHFLRGVHFFGFGRLKQLARMGMRLKETKLDARDAFPVNTHANQSYFNQVKPLRKRFPRRVKAQVLNGTDYYRLLAESKLVLNLHRDEDADIGNIRCFEVTGIGSCLVTDRREELREFFDVEHDIVTFDSVDECVEKVKYLLDHPDEIARIAKNGQRTTLDRHTVVHRCRVIASTLRQFYANPGAKRRRVVVAT